MDAYLCCASHASHASHPLPLPQLLMNVPFTAIQFMLYESTKSTWSATAPRTSRRRV